MGSTFTKISFSGDVSSNARIMSVQESGGTPRVGYIDLVRHGAIDRDLPTMPQLHRPNLGDLYG